MKFSMDFLDFRIFRYSPVPIFLVTPIVSLSEYSSGNRYHLVRDYSALNTDGVNESSSPGAYTPSNDHKNVMHSLSLALYPQVQFADG